MASLTIIPVGAISVTHADGSATRTGNPLTTSLWGNGFSWEVPDNVALTFGAATATVEFNDKNGVLTDDPFNGVAVTSQRLTAATTIDGVTYAPSSSVVRWQYPPPVNVEDEYHVTLYDAAGHAYQMVAISITTGYTTQVVGVAFLGEAPPAGTVLTYIQGVSSYTGSGQTAQIADLTVTPAAPVCFLRGTRIATPCGARRVEDLVAGDLVLTLDNGPQPVVWAGFSRVRGTGDFAPVRIAAGHVGNTRDLMVSPNHRVLLRGPQAEMLFAEAEVLVPAKFLIDGQAVRQETRAQVDYFHILMPQHDILLAEGAPAESLYLGGEAMTALEGAAREEIAAIFPGAPWGAAPPMARRSLNRHEARVLRAA